jgi:ABC-type transport system involved in multi-copper enzyme maturation permease subunit
VSAAGLRDLAASEWAKLATIRSTRWTLAAAGLVTPVLAVFVGLTGSLQPDDTELGGSLTGVVLAQLLVGVFGILVVSTEYTTGTIRLTLTACPRRRAVLAAKALVVVALTLPVGLAGATVAYVVGRALLPPGTHPPGDPWPALAGVALCLAATALVGLALGTAVRRTAGAVGALVALTLLPPLVGPLFGSLQRWVVGATPTATLQKLTQTSDASPDAVGSLGAWPSLAAYGGLALVALAVAGTLLGHRDA